MQILRKQRPESPLRKGLLMAGSLLVLGLQSSCAGSGPTDEQSCLQSWAAHGGTDRVVQVGHRYCRDLFDDDASPERRAQALCIVEEIPKVQTEKGLRLVLRACRDKHPEPRRPSETDSAHSPAEAPRTIVDPWARPTYGTPGWTQESTGSAEIGPWLQHSPPGTRFYRDADRIIYRVYPPGVKPNAEPANRFGLGDSSEQVPP